VPYVLWIAWPSLLADASVVTGRVASERREAMLFNLPITHANNPRRGRASDGPWYLRLARRLAAASWGIASLLCVAYVAWYARFS